MSRSDDIDRAVRRALQAPQLTDPPEQWVRDGMHRLEAIEPAAEVSRAAEAVKAVAGFVERVRKTAEGEIREILGQLVSDSAAGAALAGVRSGDLVARQILFQYPDAKLFLRISQQSPGRALLAGQYVPTSGDDPVESVTLHTGEGAQECDFLDEGEFQFEDVPPGDVYLSIRRQDRILAFDPIRI